MNKKILIVDDEKKIRAILAIHIKKRGYDTFEAENGNNALEILEKEQIDVILCDVKMPEMSGDQLLEIVAEKYPLIPVIMLTGYVDIDTAVEVMKKGALDFLTKPVKRENLIIAVDRAVEYSVLLKEKEILRLENEAFQKELEQKVEDRTKEIKRKSQILEKQQIELENTNRKLQEAQDELIRAERLAVIGEMAAEIGHELNNYLSIISGRAQLLPYTLEQGQNEKAVNSSKIILEQVNKMKRFTKGLMDSSTQKVQKRKSSINDIILQTIEFVKPQNRFDLIEFENILQENIPEFLFDSEQVQQVFMNLYYNAASAIKEGKIVTKTFLRNQILKIDVIDNGPGIPPELVKKIFIPGFSTKEDGHGFGLSVCQRIIENHQGQIWVENESDGGARFQIRLQV